MLKRLYVYYKERYPLFLRFLLGLIVFGEIYFIVLLNQGITKFSIGVQELIGGYTVFAFLLWLRVADDLKDYETDKHLFPDRPLPSGKTEIKDVFISCLIFEIIALVLNYIFMPNFIFCIVFTSCDKVFPIHKVSITLLWFFNFTSLCYFISYF